MGQEIDQSLFTKADFDRFHRHLVSETELLRRMVREQRFSDKHPVAGFEIETWLVNDQMMPASVNEAFLETFDDPLSSPELAKFNVELNNHPVALTDGALHQLHQELDDIVDRATVTARTLDSHIVMIGTLPTLRRASLNLQNMSPLNRYRALNEQIFRQRGQPVQLHIDGNQCLECVHDDVMLEAATASFQIHMQTPLEQAHRVYNASIIASAPMVAISANSPFLFDLDLWAETRIPLFEQSIGIGGYRDATHGSLNRVSFGSGFARQTLLECFEENLDHFPVLLPTHFDSRPEALEYLRLHNGTIWRWNRPLIGFDSDGTPHIRIEHRVIPAGPSVVDIIANAAFYYGLVASLTTDAVDLEPAISFVQAKNNFYQAARHGIDATIQWVNGEALTIQTLILKDLLIRAEKGLSILGLAGSDSAYYLDIIRQRAESGLNGCEWQRRFVRKNGKDFSALMKLYLDNQNQGKPVHQWEIP